MDQEVCLVLGFSDECILLAGIEDALLVISLKWIYATCVCGQLIKALN